MFAANRFFTQYQKDIKLFIFCFLFFQIYRALFIFIFFTHVDEDSGYYDLLQSIITGAGHDFVIAFFWALVPFLFLSVPSRFFHMQHISNKLRLWWGALFTILSVTICVCSIQFYKEYRDVFNQFLFGIFYDDTSAVMTTIIAEYNFGVNLFVIIVTVFLYLKIFQHWINKEFFSLSFVSRKLRKLNHKKIIAIFTSIVLMFFILSQNSSVKKHANSFEEELSDKLDVFLNKAVIPPFSALYEAVTEYLQIKSQHGINHFIGNSLQKELKFFFNTDKNFNNLDSYMQRTAPGSTTPKPKHIFFIVMESYDAWSMLPEYHDLKINSNLTNLGHKGLMLTNFLPASNSTMASLSSIMSGLPDAEVRTNYQASSKKPYPTSIIQHFKRLGYKTKLFFGGYPAWHKIDDFARDQGFDEILSIPDMNGAWENQNEWGIDDKSLFNFIIKNLNDDEYTFNFIMTGSNHAPFSIDLESNGFNPSEALKGVDISPYASATIRTIGHYWYADKALGEFVKEVEEKFHSNLFAITGDHYSRRHIKPNPSLQEASIVPLVLYGPNILKNVTIPKDTIGCHLDISTTLIELIAPKGFTYHTMGNNLLNPYKPYIAIGNNKVLTKDIIASSNRFNKIYQYLGDKKLSKAEIKQLVHYNNAAHAIAWWRIMRGNELKADPKTLSE